MRTTRTPGKLKDISFRKKMVFVLSIFLLSSLMTAQIPSFPVLYRPMHDPFPTFSINIDYGLGLKDIGDLSFLGIHGTVEGEKWRLSLGIGSLMSDEGDNELALGGSFAYNLRGPLKLIVIDVQGGISYSKLGDKHVDQLRQIDIPLGIGIGINARLPFSWVANLEIWLAPRFHLRHTDFNGGGFRISEWKTGYGISSGVNYFHPSGFGGRFAFELLTIKDPFMDEWRKEHSLAFGLLWGF